MKKILFFIFCICILLITGCEYMTQQSKPTGLEVNDNVLTWNKIDGALEYIVSVNDITNTVTEESYSLSSFIETEEKLSIKVKAVLEEEKETSWSSLLKINVFEVSFESSLDIASIRVLENHTLNSLPEVNDQNFLGWYFEDELFDLNTKITCSIVLEAKFAEISLIVSVVDFEYQNNVYSYTTENSTYDFTSKLNLIENATYKIFSDELKTNEVNNQVDLDYGLNYFYIQINLDDYYLVYNFNITRTYEANLVEVVGFTLENNVFKLKTNLNTLALELVVSFEASYKLYSDESCSNQITNTINLGDGINTIYVVVTSKDSLKNKTYTITIEKEEEDNNMDEIIEHLDSLYKNLNVINDNIVLITTYLEASILWESSHSDILDYQGKFKRSYKETEVSLKASITLNGVVEEVSYLVTCAGYKKLETGNIASGYQYTNYNMLTDDFFKTLDIIYCAFGLVDINGNLLNNSSTMSCLNNIKTYVLPKARKNGSWVVLSIGGGGQSDSFGNISANASIREKFADNVVSIINQYGLDGVDIDWETPTTAQSKNYTLLMEVVYNKVKQNNPNHLVTTAITGGKWQPPRYDLVNSIKYIDYVNMMTYGMTNTNGQYHNALFKSTSGKTLGSCSIDESVPIFTNLSVPKSKLIIGLSFYAMKQKKSGSSWVSDGTTTYTNIVNSILKSSTYVEYYDEESQVPYIMNTQQTELIVYDNPKSIIAKCNYAKTNNLGGVMYWQNGQDTTGQLVNAIKTAFNK